MIGLLSMEIIIKVVDKNHQRYFDSTWPFVLSAVEKEVKSFLSVENNTFYTF